MQPFGPKPPLIPGSSNTNNSMIQNLQVNTITQTNNSSGLGFFGTSAVNQQSGSSTRANNGQRTESSDHDTLISLINILNNYGLLSYSETFSGRTITFTNLTTNSPSLELYLTIGGVGNTLQSLGVFQGTGTSNSIVFDIPTTIGWTGNFQVWPVGLMPVNQLGATLFEISFNEQVYNNATNPPTLLPLRDDWDISTVPPNIPVPQLNCGPREQAVAASYVPITSAGYGYLPGNGLATSSSGGGSGMTIDLVSVSGGGITYPMCYPPYNTPGVGGYKVRNLGSGYNTGDVITVLQPMAVSLTSGGTGYTTGTFPTLNGTGTGLTVNIFTVTSGIVSVMGVASIGSGYLVGDLVTIDSGNDDATFTILSTSTANTGQLTKSDLTIYQSQMYNVGLQVIPPSPPSDTVLYPALQNPGPYWPPVTVIANSLDGNCAQAITYPNDTALPKSQVGYSQGNYTVNVVDPTVVVII